MASDDRPVLLDNERFVIGVLQVLPAASIAGAIGQVDILWPLIGEFWVLVFVTCQFLALLLSVFAAYAKHAYQVWDGRSRVSGMTGGNKAAHDRSRRAVQWLGLSHRAITLSMLSMVLGFGLFLGAAWAQWAATPS